MVRQIGPAARRQLFPADLSVGDPDDRCACYQINPHEILDAALRVDVVAALLLRVRPSPVKRAADPAPVWLTRPGTPAPHDLDAAWLAASRAAYAEAGLDLTMSVITPHGWVELTQS